MLPAVFEPAIPASDRPQTLDIGIGVMSIWKSDIYFRVQNNPTGPFPEFEELIPKFV
jgi:hypothetical protein